MVDVADKLAYFQAISGLEDPDLCTEILQAHGWDLELAISSFTSSNSPQEQQEQSPNTDNTVNFSSCDVQNPVNRSESPGNAVSGLGLAWRLITLPYSVISVSIRLVSGAVGLGLWAAGGVLSYSLGIFGLNSGRAGESSAQLVSLSAAASEAVEFLAAFDREYGNVKPNFVSEGFMDALQRSRSAFKLLFVYLHLPDHPDSLAFCEGTLCNEVLAAFVNENFVSWGGSIRAGEGFKMSNSLKASRFPFCAVVMPATNQRIALLQQVEGPKSPEEMLMILQKVIEESNHVLLQARLDAEERRKLGNARGEEQELLEREAAEAESKRREEEEAHERASREAAEREAALRKMQEEKALSLGAEPEKGLNVTQVLVRLPNGERKERRFHSTTSVQSLYDYIDSLGCLEVEDYRLISNFPRVVYSAEKLLLTLKEAGLHPQASLFVELNYCGEFQYT